MEEPIIGVGEDPNSFTATVTIRRGRVQGEVPQTRIAVAGHLRAGKSSLVGVVCTERLDDGHGSARNSVLQYNHEFESGHTSSITTHNVYFDHEGIVLRKSPLNVLNHTSSTVSLEHHTCRSGGAVVASSSSDTIADSSVIRSRGYSDLELADERITDKSISFIDLAGHEKYLKTTLHGLVGHRPDFCMLAISYVDSDSGVEADMTGEHLGIIFAIKLPFFIVLTKADVVKKEVRIQREESIISFVISTLRRKAVLIRSIEELTAFEEETNGRLCSEHTVPILATSAVTGEGFELLKKLIYRLSHQSCDKKVIPQQQQQDELEGRIMDYFPQVLPESEHSLVPETTVSSSSSLEQLQHSIPDEEKTENVVLVFIESGVLRTGHAFSLGPSPTGSFIDVLVRSIYFNKIAVEQAYHGQTVTVALKFSADTTDGYIESGLLSTDTLMTSFTPPKKKLAATIDDSSSDDLLAAVLQPTMEVSTGSAASSRYLLGRKRGAGLVILPSNNLKCAYFIFDAEVLILNHPKSVGRNYEPVIHALCVRQSARQVNLNYI